MSDFERKPEPKQTSKADTKANGKRSASEPVVVRGGGGDPRAAMYRPASEADEQRNAAARETLHALAPSLEHPFEGATIHADVAGDAQAKSHGKPAIAEGSSIYLGKEINPASPEGREIIGHEMVHVVQQTGHSAAKSTCGESAPADFEQEAHRLGSAAAGGARVTPQLRTSGPVAQGWTGTTAPQYLAKEPDHAGAKEPGFTLEPMVKDNLVNEIPGRTSRAYIVSVRRTAA